MLNQARRWVYTAIIFIYVVACAPGAGQVITECVVNADQAALFKGHWNSKPIPLGVVANDFDAGEITAIQNAIGTWNTHFSAAKGFVLYMSGSSSLSQVSSGGTRITSSTACSQTVIGPSGFTGRIMIYKNATTWAFGTSVIGVTSLCPVTVANAQFRTFISAVMELNYIDYFKAGKPVPDLESVLLHELGHLLGLDHSCNGTGCTNVPDDYRAAVMYPALGFDGTVGHQKRTLQTNDQGRANCLY